MNYLSYEKPASGCAHHSWARTPNAGCAGLEEKSFLIIQQYLGASCEIVALLLVLLVSALLALLALLRCLLIVDHLLGFGFPVWTP
jgi:hypothetical protein